MLAIVAGVIECACSADPPIDAICRDRSQQIGALIDKADSWCLKDADCAVFMPATSCFWTCGVVIRADAVDTLSEQLRRAEIEICSADGIQCPPPAVLPPCLFLHAKCYNNGCTD